MTAIWRGLVWIVGSLSVAVLLRDAFDARLVSVLQRLLDGYDAMLALVLAPLEPFMALLLPPLSASIGGGPALQSHWTHVFLVTLLHMLPRIDATFGVSGVRAGALWSLQALGALMVAMIGAAYVGAAPFVAARSEEGVFVGVFIATALVISFFANFRDTGETDADDAERSAAERQSWDRSYVISAFTIAFVVAMICLGAIALMLGWLDRLSAEWLLAAVFVLWLIAIWLRRLYIALFAPRDEIDDWLAESSLVTTGAMLAMLLALLPLADQLSPRYAASPTAWLILLLALLPAFAWIAGRNLIGRLAARDNTKYDSRATPALGVFIAVGAAIVTTGVLAS